MTTKSIPHLPNLGVYGFDRYELFAPNEFCPKLPNFM